MSGLIRPTRIEVDLDAVVGNARVVRALTGTPVLAVVKADGYGHGAAPVAAALEASGQVAGFAVSLVEEGVALRAAGLRAPILVMGPSHHGGADELVARTLTPVISDPADWAELSAVARARGLTVDVHLKVDTGMARLGLTQAAAAELAGRRGDGLRVVGLMTHFACADVDDPSADDNPTYRQLARFAEAEAVVRAAGAPLVVRHAANSSAAMLFPGARLDQVRTGIALYGNGAWASAADAGPALARRQAMRLVTRIAQLRTVEVGASVGYGALWTATRPTRVAVLPLGYADGLPRRTTGHGQVLIGGRRCPLVGAVSMDIAIADVTDVPGVAPGDDATLLGGDGGGRQIRTAELAAWSALSEYEVTCGMSKRVPRVYVGGAAAR